jgi:hypothetical protein
MYTLQGKTMRYVLNELGQVVSVYNKLTCHEYVYQPGDLWKLIYQEGERTEIPVVSTGQSFSVNLDQTENKEPFLCLTYDGLRGDGRDLQVRLVMTFILSDEALSVYAELVNNDPSPMMELQLTAVSGVRSLSGDHTKDAIAWPVDLGRRIPDPAYSDLSVYAGFRKYERHDQYHTDLNGLYPGRLSMQWYDWYNEGEGLYVGSHDPSHQSTCLHVERDVKQNILRMGVVRYPMLNQGERWQSAPLVYAVHTGDWHAGARIYRNWIENGGGWHTPDQPEWMLKFKGWLRVILKQHHMELNWDYSQVPALYDEAAASGLDTIFLLGWERGGFARLWPDYVVDERMGGEAGLRAAIDIVHAKGGKVILFLSYALIDRDSEYYKNGPGRNATIKSLWGDEIPFAETYCGEGTWRKLGNPAMPMYLSCAGSPDWQEKMIDSARYCLDLGADGVLYDIGGITPYFCYDEGHTHAKPSHSCSDKARRYGELHDYIRSRGDDKAIMMEHNIDVFAQHMDLSQGGTTRPGPMELIELYRYTFPELIMTNRNVAHDEVNYRENANYSFVYGLRFDMSIYRCCGSLSDLPNYAAYLKELNDLRAQYQDFLLKGRFIDQEGFCLDNTAIVAKGYKADDGRVAVALWNRSDCCQCYALSGSGQDGTAPAAKCGELAPDSVAVVILDS